MIKIHQSAPPMFDTRRTTIADLLEYLGNNPQALAAVQANASPSSTSKEFLDMSAEEQKATIEAMPAAARTKFLNGQISPPPKLSPLTT
jgi:hypothetical protein